MGAGQRQGVDGAEQRAELAVLQQVLPAFQQAAEVLHHPETTSAERVRLAGQIEQMADQAAEGEEPGSPWLAAAAGLRALAVLLRGREPDLAALTPTYRSLIRQVQGTEVNEAEETA